MVENADNDLVDYFAYGSNLSTEQMESRGVDIYDSKKAILPGWDLVFTEYSDLWEGGVADIVYAGGSKKVEGVVYKIDMGGVSNLDRYEGREIENGREVGMYRKHYLPVKMKDGWKTVLTYVMNLTPEYKRKTYIEPSERYLDTIIQGLKEHDTSEDYIQGLKGMKDEMKNPQ